MGELTVRLYILSSCSTHDMIRINIIISLSDDITTTVY